MLHLIRDLYTHMEWADALVWRNILATPGTGTDDAMLDLLVHLHNTQHAFLDLWVARPVGVRQREEFLTPVAIAAWAQRFHTEASAILSQLDATFESALPIPWARFFQQQLGRRPAPVTVGESLVQVALHSVHHRAQAVRQLKIVGGQPPMVDYIAWLWMGRPAPVWPKT